MLAALRSEGDRFREVTPSNDDIWVSAVAVRAGIQTWQIRPTPADFPQVPGTQVGTLWGRNVRDGGNDPQIAATYGDAEIALLRSEPGEVGSQV